jgi:hypothetical protein
MVVEEGTDTHRQIKTTPHNKNIMEMTEEAEGGCRPGEVAEADRCKDRRQPMELEVDTIKEVVGKAEGILPMVGRLAEEVDQHRWSDLLLPTLDVSIIH